MMPFKKLQPQRRRDKVNSGGHLTLLLPLTSYCACKVHFPNYAEMH